MLNFSSMKARRKKSESNRIELRHFSLFDGWRDFDQHLAYQLASNFRLLEKTVFWPEIRPPGPSLLTVVVRYHIKLDRFLNFSTHPRLAAIVKRASLVFSFFFHIHGLFKAATITRMTIIIMMEKKKTMMLTDAACCLACYLFGACRALNGEIIGFYAEHATVPLQRRSPPRKLTRWIFPKDRLIALKIAAAAASKTTTTLSNLLCSQLGRGDKNGSPS